MSCKQKKKIGVMGGTFNPIHMGHLMMSEFLRSEEGIDSVIFIPSGNPPHKQDIEIDAYDRLEMVKIATEPNPEFCVSSIEIDRPGLTYSIDTLRILKEEYPTGEFYFFLGSDIIMDLKDWKKFDELAELCTFLCAIRPGFDRFSLEDIEREIIFLKEKFDAEVKLIQTPRYEISSSDLRARLAEGKSVKYLIPEPVIDFICSHDLYEGCYEV